MLFIRYAVICCLIPVFFYNCKSTISKYPRVTITTGEGDIVLELYPDKAPATVAAFLSLVDKELYNNSSFYRVLNSSNQPSDAFKADLLQGGRWNRRKQKIQMPLIPHESTQQTGLHHLNGSVSMARDTVGSASTEFFICLADQPGLDFGGENNADGQGYAVFGKVIEGMDIIYKISLKPETDQYFDPPVPIFSIK